MSDPGGGLVVPSPCAGRVLSLGEVPDPVFAGSMVGLGAAVDPVRERTTVVSPLGGTILKLHPHAFVVLTPDGAGVLVHLGINTARLGGEGFEVHATEGATVEAGAPMVTWDPGAMPAAQDLSPVVPVVVMDRHDGTVQVDAGAVVAPGDRLYVLR